MINYKLIFKIIGSLLYIESALMLVCLAISFVCRQDDLLAFLYAVILTVFGATLLKYFGQDAKNSLGRRDAYLLVSLTWIIFSFFGSLPFIISGYITNFTDAYFETISGFTTTGCSILDDVEKLPMALFFWRTMTQWIGGLGIVFFTIAILPSFGNGNVRVFAAEATGPIRAKMHPRLSTQAKWIWSIYLLLTVTCGGCYYLSGMNTFDAVNYAMTTTATGGFSTHNEATGFYHNPLIDYTAIVFMFLSGISFTLFYMVLFKRKVKQLLYNAEFKFYVGTIVAATLLIAVILLSKNNYNLSDAVRVSLFQVTSFITTTGIFNEDVSLWPHLTWIILCVCMFLGGCSGSTSGGFKCIRAVMSVTVLHNEIKKMIHPRAMLPVRVNQTNVPLAAQVTLLAFIMAYLLLCLFTYVVMTMVGIDGTNAITIALSCASNVGPSLSLGVGEPMSWASFPAAIKWLLGVLMLMGRLEIFSVVVLFSPSFWKNN